MKEHKKYCYMALPVIGVLFYLIYIHKAAIDLVYSDYIRLINSYLPDVWNPQAFFVPDLLTRIPLNYVSRIINVKLFGYSVTYDRVMGILSFGLSSMCIASYSYKKQIGLGWYAAMMVVMFSLNKWEMLYNGTGWIHFFAFACFFYNYLIVDRIYYEKSKAAKSRREIWVLCVLPALITIGVAGPYCAIYTMTLVLAYLFIYIRNRIIIRPDKRKLDVDETSGAVGIMDKRLSRLTGKQTALLLCMTVWPLLVYIWSNSKAEYEYVGAVQEPLLTSLLAAPKFFVKFFLKSFASMVFGVEMINRRMGDFQGKVWCLVGFLVVLSYLLAVWLNFYYKIAEETLLPLMLLAGGGMNHMIVLLNRWIFMNDTYGMSSRYALQYQVGIIGIFLTFALVAKAKKKEKTSEKKWEKRVHTLMFVVAFVFVAGNVATTIEELDFCHHRKYSNELKVPVLLNYEDATEDELKFLLEYQNDGVKEALTILKENHWNIFGPNSASEALLQ